MFFKKKKKAELERLISDWDILAQTESKQIINPPGFHRNELLTSHWSLTTKDSQGITREIAFEKLSNDSIGIHWSIAGKTKKLMLNNDSDADFIKNVSFNLQLLSKELLFYHLTEIKKLPPQQSSSFDNNVLETENKSIEWLKATLTTLKGAITKAQRNPDLLLSGQLVLNNDEEHPQLKLSCYNLNIEINWNDPSNVCQLMALDQGDSSGSKQQNYQAQWKVLRVMALEEMTQFLGTWSQSYSPIDA